MPLIQPPGHTRLALGGASLAHCEKSTPMPGAAIATPPTEFICTTTCDPCVEAVKLSDPRNTVGITDSTATNIDKARLREISLIRREALSWFIFCYLSLLSAGPDRVAPAKGVRPVSRTGSGSCLVLVP